MCSGSKCDMPGLKNDPSSSKCDMAGLINGPVGSIVGIGIKALMNGAPIGPRSAEALRKPSDKENIQQFYDNVEAHLKGALQILTPALEIKKVLLGECKSAEPPRSALTPSTPIVYYSPQNQLKSQSNACSARCCGQKKSTTGSTDKWSSAKSSKNNANKLSAEIKAQSSCSSSASIKCKRSAESKCSPCFAGETSSISSSSKYDNKGKSSKDSAKSSKSKQGQCCMCYVSLKENIMLAVLPCEHLFCYTCLAKGKNRCQKCDKSFDMKNISQIFYKRT